MRRLTFLTIPLLALSACGGADEPKTASRTPTPEATAAPAPAPITFGSQRYISPCSVLPLRDAERIYGRMGPLGHVRQEFYDASMTKAEFRKATANVSESVRTVCHYNRRDRRTTAVKVEVQQYRSERDARAEWRSIAYLGTGKDSRDLAERDLTGPDHDFSFIKKLARENERDMGGKPLAGMKEVLYVKGRADFVGTRANAVVRVSYLPLTFGTPVFSARQAKRQAAKAKPAFRVIFDRLEGGDLQQEPAPVTIGAEKEVNGTPYLDPCRILDPETFRLATGRAQTESVSSMSLPKDTAALRETAGELYGQSPEATCERTARHGSKTDRAELSVRVAARPQGEQIRSVGTELAGDWMINLYVNEEARDRATVRALAGAGVVEQITADQTKADALYIFDSTLKTGRKEAFREAFFNVGPYAFRLDVNRRSGLGLYSGRDLEAGAYRRVVDAIAERVRTVTRR